MPAQANLPGRGPRSGHRLLIGIAPLIGVACALLLTGCSADRASAPRTAAAPPSSATQAVGCPGADPSVKHVYWGDLHVHTAYSLDAYGYGTMQTPADAFRFAKGERLDLATGPVQLERPLDFMAVTDHAEWFDLMHTCTDPGMSGHPVCRDLRANSTPTKGSNVFKTYVVPTITLAKPEPTQLCKDDPKGCLAARDNQWTRVQKQANDANAPCRFTAFIGFEWSATPNASHTHRNVVFASDHVTAFPIDYIRYPKASELWDQLARQCRPEDGCDVIAIAHNMNMGDGASFDVETEDENLLALRARYERLVEVTQEKGASECLPPYAERTTNKDCDFENYITSHSKPATPADFTEADWERMRASYARGLLRRGLLARARTGLNPLQVGFVGSTDTHTGLGGAVEEDQWPGSVWGIGDFDRSMGRLGFNPGGIVGVWAEQNTRESIFAALKRRETYATSGPRITLRFHAAPQAAGLSCASLGGKSPGARATPMGGTLLPGAKGPVFRIEAVADKAPLARIEIVKGSTKKGGFEETVQTVWTPAGDATHACVMWRDKGFDPGEQAYWYPRVIQAPTPRWSAVMCRKAGRCAEFPGADRTVEERAWGSPIWYAPG